MYGHFANNVYFKFFESILNSTIPEPDRNDLGQGIKLVPDTSIEDNRLQYCHLYKNGVKLSNSLFRKGGSTNDFKQENYCSLIKYDNLKKDTLGEHVIIDNTGKIVLASKDSFKYPYFHKGIIASMDSTYYNLLTGKAITKGTANIKSKQFLFIENNYNKEFPLGVYKICYQTGEFEFFN